MNLALDPSGGIPAGRLKKLSEDMTPEEFEVLKKLLAKFFGEEESEPAHAADADFRMALDRESVRQFDAFGRMHVIEANLSKADVNPYLGKEIPGWRDLGLEPDKVYQLWRPAEELEKAAATSNGIPLLRKHIPVSADDHKKNDTVGATGTDGRFEAPFLKNSLVVWTSEDIAQVESSEKRELSCGYRYRPEMTVGTFDGKPYDGVMRDIVFNHVALVEDGRAGDEVVIGDSKENLMTKPTRLGAFALQLTAASVAPLLAQDAALVLPKQMFSEITSKNIRERKAGLLAGVRLALDGKLRSGVALDATVEGLTNLLNALEETAESADESVSKEEHNAMEAAAHGESNLGIPKSVGEEFEKADKGKTFDAEPFKAFLKSKGVGDADIEEAMKFMPNGGGAEDESEEDAEKKAEEERRKKEAEDKRMGKDKDTAGEADKVTKGAMDQAIDAAVKTARKQEREIAAAREDVRPWVGALPTDMAADSAADVYAHTLKALGVDGVDASIGVTGLKAILKHQPKPGSETQRSTHGKIAMDSAASKSAEDKFGLNRIGAA